MPLLAGCPLTLEAAPAAAVRHVRHALLTRGATPHGPGALHCRQAYVLPSPAAAAPGRPFLRVLRKLGHAHLHTKPAQTP